MNQIGIAVLCLILPCIGTCSGLGCFVCQSINGSDPDCEDPFNSTALREKNNSYYEDECFAVKRGRQGLFPASRCIKMKGNDEASNYSVTVRMCVTDGGGVTSETEIGSVSHCGWVKRIILNGKQMDGCVLSCDQNGCNAGFILRINTILLYTLSLGLLLSNVS